MENSKLSPRQRIALHCRVCTADPAAPGSWRHQIGLCPVNECALWPLRPMPTKLRPVTAELLAEYHVPPDDPAVADLRAKGLLLETPPTPATASCGAILEAIGSEEYEGKGAG